MPRSQPKVFDYRLLQSALRFAAKQLATDTPIREQMRSLISWCRERTGYRGWIGLADLPYESQLPAAASWLTELLPTSPPPTSVRAFYFGIFEQLNEDNKLLPVSYACGSTRYDPNDRSWPCRPRWFPEGRYRAFAALEHFYDRFIERGDDIGIKRWELLGLAYTMFSLKTLAHAIPPRAWLGRARQRFIGFGFDEGEPYTLGVITHQGFKPRFVIPR